MYAIKTPNGFLRSIENDGTIEECKDIRGGGSYSIVTCAFFDEACTRSDWVGELFAIKEPRHAVYSSFSTQ